MILIPQRVEVLHPVWPITNFVILGLCVLATGVWFSDIGGFLDHIALVGWNPLGLFFHTLLHDGIMHLVFNMLYLWVFGNAICAKFGNAKFLLIFFGGALASAVLHLVMDGHPAVGASGAINAIIGVFLVLYPVNKIHCFYWVYIRAGCFPIKAYWLIGLWFLTDILGVFSGGGDIAFWAHIGGFLAGVAFGFWALKANWVEMSELDNETLLDIVMGRQKEFENRPAPKPEIRKQTRRRVRPDLRYERAADDSPEQPTGSPLKPENVQPRPRRQFREFTPEKKSPPPPENILKLKSFNKDSPKDDSETSV